MKIKNTTKALLDVPKAGRVILAYILEHNTEDGTLIELDKPKIVQWMSQKYSSMYASTINVNRGIKELKDEGVLTEYIDTDPVTKVGRVRYSVTI